MKKIVSVFFVVLMLGAEALNAGCTVRLPCSNDANDFVECDGMNCKRTKGTYKSQNKVECDGVETKCTEGTLPAILEFL